MWTRALARHFPKDTVGGSNCALWVCPKTNNVSLAPPQKQHIFNSHLNYLNCLDSEYELLTQLNCFCWRWYTCNNCLVLTITTFKMRGVVMRYYLCPLTCKFWWEHFKRTLCSGNHFRCKQNLNEALEYWNKAPETFLSIFRKACTVHPDLSEPHLSEPEPRNDDIHRYFAAH